VQAQIITGIRVRLQRRWRRIRGATVLNLRFPLLAYRDFILNDPTCSATIQAVADQHPIPDADIELVCSGKGSISPEGEAQAASIAWKLLTDGLLAEGVDDRRLADLILAIARSNGSGARQYDEAATFVVETILEPLFDYLDEQLDDRAEVLATLVRFQRWTAWFGNTELVAVVEAESRAVESGEKTRQQCEKRLQGTMFEWLNRDGLPLKDMDHEPLTGVGRPDFKFVVHGNVIASEVKLFGTFGGTTYRQAGLRSGVRQLLEYMEQYACTTGYFVVFNRDPRGLRCHFPDHHDGVPRLEVSGNRSIYVLVIPAIEAVAASSARTPVVLRPSDLLGSASDGD